MPDICLTILIIRHYVSDISYIKNIEFAIRACGLGSDFFCYDENEMRICVKK